MKKIFVALLLVSMFTLTACGSKENKETENTNNETETEPKEKDYSGVFKSDDSSELTIAKDKDSYKVNITIYRLGQFPDCTVDEIKNDVLYISSIDPSEKPIKFTFNYNTKVLNVTDSSWNLLTTDDSFIFDK